MQMRIVCAKTCWYSSAKIEEKKTPLFKLGQIVRLKIESKIFARGYDPSSTIEHFTINNIFSNLPGEPRYSLTDSSGELIIGNFFEDELIAYKPEEKYGVTVLNTRGSGKNKEHFVSYTGYPKKFNEWLPIANFV